MADKTDCDHGAPLGGWTGVLTLTTGIPQVRCAAGKVHELLEVGFGLNAIARLFYELGVVAAPQEVQHESDCAVHREPAESNGPCNCVIPEGDSLILRRYNAFYAGLPNVVEGSSKAEIAMGLLGTAIRHPKGVEL